MAVELFVKRCKSRFDYIFLDPPFPYKFHEQLVAQCAERSLLADGGILMVHRPSERAMPEKIAGLSLSDRRNYGRSIVDFYKIAE